MDVLVTINSQFYRVRCLQYYLPIILLDMRPFHILCEVNNSIEIDAENPRTHIDRLHAVFQFFFHEWPPQSHLGQVVSRFSLIYNQANPQNFDYSACILFLSNTRLDEILLYTPSQENFIAVMKELQIKFLPRKEGFCVICLEEKLPVVNVHQDTFEHEICTYCLMMWKKTICPLCRQMMNLRVPPLSQAVVMDSQPAGVPNSSR